MVDTASAACRHDLRAGARSVDFGASDYAAFKQADIDAVPRLQMARELAA